MIDDLHKVFSVIGDVFHSIWKYNLVTVSGKSIAVSNIVFALILFLIGLRYSTNFRNFVRNYVKTKVNSNKDAANALERIIIYLAFCIYIITILDIANVPLSTFAFVGGALAIGIGFGGQTVIGNFISSLVIILEKPIKIGDIIDVDGIIGTVTAMGARCVTVTTPTNVEILIPNSKLVSHILANWTLSDSILRYHTEVTIPRHADKRDKPVNIPSFIKKLRTTIDGLEFVLESYEPEIHLTKISENQLTFLLNFDCDVHKVNNPEYVKSALNIALLDNLKDFNFIVDHFKISENKKSGNENEEVSGEDLFK